MNTVTYPTEEAAARVAAWLAGIEYTQGETFFTDEHGWSYCVIDGVEWCEIVFAIDIRDEDGNHQEYFNEENKNLQNPTQPID
tara:strand:+ start:896 stop:1144 length:249 start_codon:yes stop_codon:yes gene_type:complete